MFLSLSLLAYFVPVGSVWLRMEANKPGPILCAWLADRPVDRRIEELLLVLVVAGAGAVAATAAALNSAHGYCLPDHLGNCWPTALPANRT